MISKKMHDAINTQINKEMYSAYLYLSMANYCKTLGYDGFANWLTVQYHEEMFHAMKFYEYLHDQGSTPVLQAIAAPPAEFKFPIGLVEQVLEHEKTVTKSIWNLMDIAKAENDHASVEFLQWYVKEQVEEEKNATDILTKLKLLKPESSGIFFIDKALGKRAANIPLAFNKGVGDGD